MGDTHVPIEPTRTHKNRPIHQAVRAEFGWGPDGLTSVMFSRKRAAKTHVLFHVKNVHITELNASADWSHLSVRRDPNID